MSHNFGTPWSDAEIAILKKMHTAPGPRIVEILSKLHKQNPSLYPSERSSSAVRNKRRLLEEIGEIIPPQTETFKEGFLKIQEIQSNHYSGITNGTLNYKTENANKKILSMSDIHFPFARVDLLQQIIDTHHDADEVVLNGDIVEGYAYSSYNKSRSVYAVDEYNCMFAFVGELLKIFPHITLVEGNHEDRLARYLSRLGVGEAQNSLFRPSIMSRIANGEELDEHGATRSIHQDYRDHITFREKERWWTKIGQTIFIHPSSKITSAPGFAVGRWHQAFSNRFPSDYYDSMVCGHTHAVYKGVIEGKLLIEEGCLSGFMDYEWSRQEVSLLKAMNGYAVIYQDEFGNTDFNKSNVFYLGYVSPENPN